MKKRKIKEIIISSTVGIMSILAPFSFVGCKTNEQPLMTNEEAYVILVEHISDFKTINDDKTHQTFVNMGLNTTTNVDFSESKLPNSTQTMLEDLFKNQYTESQWFGQQEYYYNEQDNSGYYSLKNITHSKFGGITTQVLDVTQKQGDKLINYFYKDTEENVIPSYVNQSYAKNTYNYTHDNLQIDSMEVASILSTIKELSSYEEFLNKKYETVLGVVSSFIDKEIKAEDLLVNINMSTKNKEHILNVDIAGEDIITSEDDTTSECLDIDASFTIVFGINGLISIDTTLYGDADIIIPSKTFVPLEMDQENLGITEENCVSVHVSEQHILSINFDANLNYKDTITSFNYNKCLTNNQLDNIANKEKIIVRFYNDSEIYKEFEVYENQKFIINTQIGPEKEGYKFLNWNNLRDYRYHNGIIILKESTDFTPIYTTV